MREKIEKLIVELIQLGEDPEELKFWQTIFPDMTKTEQQELVVILTAEVQSLQKANL